MKVEMIKSPSEQDWEWCRICTLNTVGLTPKTKVTEQWKIRLIKSEHSPMRELWFGFKLEIPYWVSVHLVRHHIGCNHYVQSQRNDRQDKYDREKAAQGEMVSHIFSINAQELVQVAHKRLCNQASKETREVVEEMCKLVTDNYPEFKGILVPLCDYRNGKCTEFFPCGRSERIWHDSV